jgi:hypothetical protein
MTSANRIVNQLGLHGDSQGDAELVAQLQLLKTPAIIRDTKQVFLYVQCFANTTTKSPYKTFINRNNTYVAVGGTPPNDTVAPFDVPPYYCPIGTKRRFRIWEQVNDLIDVRIPKDKYYLDINMVEAQVEANPENWTKQRHFTKDPTATPNEFELRRTFNVEYEYDGAAPAQGSTQFINKTYFKEATKKSIPQPIFARIPQLSNGEPYNWTTVNNGQYNEDKSHNVVVRHGDVNYEELELEFGHLTFQGTDTQYEQEGANTFSSLDTAPQPDPEWNTNLAGPQVANQISNFQKYKYLDLNWEWDNAETQGPNTNINNQYVAPASRNEDIVVNKDDYLGGAVPGTVVVQGEPLFYNQQIANLTFRFVVKLVHLF